MRPLWDGDGLGAGHRIVPRWIKLGFGGRSWNDFFVRRAPNSFGERFGTRLEML
jgi:hypothetical protein